MARLNCLLNHLKDISINVAAPMLAGLAIYIAGVYFTLPEFAKNYAADGLWAYAFISCILIVWDRNIHRVWIPAALSTTIAFEALQYAHILRGTGDPLDVVVYFFSATIALLLNRLIKQLYQNKKHALT